MLKLMYITNNTKIAKVAENAGVDRIFIDLEIIGKEKRQGHLDTVISYHSVDDIKKIKDILKKAELLVRINPIYKNSKSEIDEVIEKGADIVMLPFFKTKEEVEQFIKCVDKRAKTSLLVETPEAVEILDKILSVEGIDEIHIGLNDLHLGYKMKFMFELVTNGTVEKICKKIRNKGITYGFGGISKLGTGLLPAENIITEHYRLESKVVILSRSFCDSTKVTDMDEITDLFKKEVEKIRNYENQIKNSFSEKDFEQNIEIMKLKVNEIIK